MIGLERAIGGVVNSGNEVVRPSGVQDFGRMADVQTPHLDDSLALLKLRARVAGLYGAR